MREESEDVSVSIRRVFLTKEEVDNIIINHITNMISKEPGVDPQSPAVETKISYPPVNVNGQAFAVVTFTVQSPESKAPYSGNVISEIFNELKPG